jgi:hypothetical protein
MLKWIRKFWMWLVGAPIIAAFASVVFRRWRQSPIGPTKKQADKEHTRIDKKLDEDLKAIDEEFDEDLKDAMSKFGG